jgi:hypothetical protein
VQRAAATSTHSGPESPTNHSEGLTSGLSLHDMSSRPAPTNGSRTTCTAKLCRSQGVISIFSSDTRAGGSTVRPVLASTSPQPGLAANQSPPRRRMGMGQAWPWQPPATDSSPRTRGRFIHFDFVNGYSLPFPLATPRRAARSIRRSGRGSEGKAPPPLRRQPHRHDCLAGRAEPHVVGEDGSATAEQEIHPNGLVGIQGQRGCAHEILLFCSWPSGGTCISENRP